MAVSVGTLTTTAASIIHNCMSFWATVCKTVRPMLSDRCPVMSVLSVCLSVTLVYCGQTVGWIKMKLGTKVDLSPGHIVLDGDPVPPKKRPNPQFSARVRCGQTLDGLRCHLVWTLAPSLGVIPFEFCGDLRRQKTRVPGL